MLRYYRILIWCIFWITRTTLTLKINSHQNFLETIRYHYL